MRSLLLFIFPFLVPAFALGEEGDFRIMLGASESEEVEEVVSHVPS